MECNLRRLSWKVGEEEFEEDREFPREGEDMEGVCVVGEKRKTEETYYGENKERRRNESGELENIGKIEIKQ